MLFRYQYLLNHRITALLTLVLCCGTVFAQKPIDPVNFDTSVKPSDDFYQYVNGGWLAKNPIPADQSRWGSFSILQETNLAVLHGIVDDAVVKTDAPKGSIAQKVGDFYFSGMDSASIEAKGASPLT